MPRLRADLIFDYEATLHRLSSQQERSRRVGMTAQLDAAIAHHERGVAHLAEADLIWVTRDMVRLVMDAATDVPSFTPGGLPTENGIALFGAPLPPLESPSLYLASGRPWRGELPVWGVWWHPRDHDSLSVDIVTRLDALPEPIMGRADLQPAYSLVVPRWAGLQLDDETGVVSDTGDVIDRAHLGVLSMLAALSHLSQMPTLAKRERLDARTGKAPRQGRTRPQDEVTLVDLRPMREERAEVDGTGRVYTHRWMVRGHWAQQAYGPGRALRKTIYREPFIKGPAGAPLLAREEVMVWRR